jgi:hypothetical protein
LYILIIILDSNFLHTNELEILGKTLINKNLEKLYLEDLKFTSIEKFFLEFLKNTKSLIKFRIGLLTNVKNEPLNFEEFFKIIKENKTIIEFGLKSNRIINLVNRQLNMNKIIVPELKISKFLNDIIKENKSITKFQYKYSNISIKIQEMNMMI